MNYRLHWFRMIGFRLKLYNHLWEPEIKFPISLERALEKALKTAAHK